MDDTISSNLHIITGSTPINNSIPTPSRLRKPSVVANGAATPSNLPILSTTSRHKRGSTVQFQESMFNDEDSGIPKDLHKKLTIDSVEFSEKPKSSIYSFNQNSNHVDNLQRELDSLKLEFSKSGNSRPDIHQAILQLEAEMQQQFANKSANVIPNSDYSNFINPSQSFNPSVKLPASNIHQNGFYPNQNPIVPNQAPYIMPPPQQHYYPNQQYVYPTMQPPMPMHYPNQFGGFPVMPTTPFDASMYRVYLKT